MLCKIKALEKKKQLQGLIKEQIETCTELKSTLGKRKAKDAESEEQIHTDVHANSEQSTKVCFWNELESNMVKRARMNYRSSLAWLKEGFTNVCRVFFFFFFFKKNHIQSGWNLESYGLDNKFFYLCGVCY